VEETPIVHQDALRQELEECIAAFRRGELTEERLCGPRDLLHEEGRPRQDLLYLQTMNTSVSSPVRGMVRVINGRLDEGPEEEWPYRCVLDAIRDGWRVIQFPDLLLLMDETRAQGLGCEFILERWHAP
jgi:hypothetical protein